MSGFDRQWEMTDDEEFTLVASFDQVSAKISQVRTQIYIACY